MTRNRMRRILLQFFVSSDECRDATFLLYGCRIYIKLARQVLFRRTCCVS